MGKSGGSSFSCLDDSWYSAKPFIRIRYKIKQAFSKTSLSLSLGTSLKYKIPFKIQTVPFSPFSIIFLAAYLAPMKSILYALLSTSESGHYICYLFPLVKNRRDCIIVNQLLDLYTWDLDRSVGKSIRCFFSTQ